MSGSTPMSGMRAISRNAAWLLAGRVAALGLTALFTVLLARRLGPAGFGAYAVVAATVFLANVVTTFGTDMVLIREVAARAGTPRWAAALTVQLGLSMLAIVAIWLLAPLAGAVVPGVATALVVYSFSLVPAAFYAVATALLRGAGRMGAYAALGVAAAALQLAVLPLLDRRASLVDLMVALLFVQIAMGVVAWVVCAARSPELRARARPTLADVAVMLRATGTIGVLGMLGMAYQRVPVLVLAASAGPASAGWFAGSAKIVEASKTPHVALYAAVYPAMAEAHASGVAGGRGLSWSRRLALGSACALSAVLVLASPLAVRALLGSSFGPSAPGLAILALALVPSAFSTYQSLDLVARHRETSIVRVQAAALGALLCLLAVLVPALGWIGGCWAVLGAEALQAGLMLGLTQRTAMPAVRRSSRILSRPAAVAPRSADGSARPTAAPVSELR